MCTLGVLARDAARAVELTESSLRKYLAGKDLVVSAVVLRARASTLLEHLMLAMHTRTFVGRSAKVQATLLKYEKSHVKSFVDGSATLQEISVLKEVLRLAHVVFESELRESVPPTVHQEIV